MKFIPGHSIFVSSGSIWLHILEIRKILLCKEQVQLFCSYHCHCLILCVWFLAFIKTRLTRPVRISYLVNDISKGYYMFMAPEIIQRKYTPFHVFGIIFLFKNITIQDLIAYHLVIHNIIWLPHYLVCFILSSSPVSFDKNF